jgi:hypothetical protein
MTYKEIIETKGDILNLTTEEYLIVSKLPEFLPKIEGYTVDKIGSKEVKIKA